MDPPDPLQLWLQGLSYLLDGVLTEGQGRWATEVLNPMAHVHAGAPSLAVNTGGIRRPRSQVLPSRAVGSRRQVLASSKIFVVIGDVDLSASFVSVEQTASRSWLPGLRERFRRHSSLASACGTVRNVRFERVSLSRARSDDSLHVQALLSRR